MAPHKPTHASFQKRRARALRAARVPTGKLLPIDPKRRRFYVKPHSVHRTFREQGREGLTQLRRAVADAAKSQRTVERYEKTFLYYKDFCERIGLEALPLSTETLCLFVTEKCNDTGNGRSASIWRRQVISHVTHWTGERPEFSSAETQTLLQHEKGCKEIFGNYSTQTPGISGDELREIYYAVRPSPEKDISEWVTWVYAVLAYNCLLRPNEFSKGSGVRVRDVRMLGPRGKTPAGLQLTLWNTKGQLLRHRSDPEFAFAARSASMDPLDACALLDRYFEIFDLQREDRLDRPLFALYEGPSDGMPGGLSSIEMSNDVFNRRFAALQVAAGRPIEKIRTARDLRSGRRTDLAVAGIADTMVMLMGRWSTLEACNTYMRASQLLLKVLRRHSPDL